VALRSNLLTIVADDASVVLREGRYMRSIVLVVTMLLTAPVLALAHHPPKPHPKIQDHKFNHKIKKAMKQAECCDEGHGHHLGLHHGKAGGIKGLLHHKKPALP
jgi:hypothetical protein